MRRSILLLVFVTMVAAACMGTEDSAINNEDSAINNEDSAINNEDSATGTEDSALGVDVLPPAAEDQDAPTNVDGVGAADDVESAPDADGVVAPTATVPDQGDLAPNAVVDRVVDGDTIIVEIAGDRERVRLLGIDTPESVAENRPDQCFGEESADYLRTLLPEGTDVTLIRDVEARDQFDRLLAYVVRSSDQLFVNLDLLERGFAGVLIYEPNSFYRDLFEDAEDTAFANDVGLWGVCGGPDVPLD